MFYVFSTNLIKVEKVDQQDFRINFFYLHVSQDVHMPIDIEIFTCMVPGKMHLVCQN